MDKKKIKYMINPKYLKSCIDLELKKAMINEKYIAFEEKIENVSNKLGIPKILKDKLNEVNLNKRNEQIVDTYEKILDEQTLMEQQMDKQIKVVKIMIKERMDRHE